MNKQSNNSVNLSNVTRFAILLAALFACLFPSIASADEVKIKGFWIPNVQIQEIVDGKLYYTTRTGDERNTPMTEVGGMKITTYPDVEKVFAALEAKDDEAALAAARAVSGKAREPWLKNWATAYEVLMLDRLEDPVRAVQKYLQLITQNADDTLLAAAPLTSLKTASEGQKEDLIRRIERAQRRAKGVSAEKLAAMLTILQKDLASKEDAKPAAGSSGSSSTPATKEDKEPAVDTTVALGGIGGQTAGEQAAIESVVPVSRYLDAKDPVTQMIAKGEFDKALEEANRQLAGKTRTMAQRLYQRGLAQLYLAEKSGDAKGYKDAGLSFARVLAYFDKSSYAGPAALELGYVHMKLGMNNHAVKLLQDAGNMLDEESEPELWERLETIMTQ